MRRFVVYFGVTAFFLAFTIMWIARSGNKVEVSTTPIISDSHPPHLDLSVPRSQYSVAVLWRDPVGEQPKNMFLCMGTLVDGGVAKVVLTAYSCFKDIKARNGFPDGLTIRIYIPDVRECADITSSSSSPSPSPTTTSPVVDAALSSTPPPTCWTSSSTLRCHTSGKDAAGTHYCDAVVDKVILGKDTDAALLVTASPLPLRDDLLPRHVWPDLDDMWTDYESCTLSGYTRNGTWLSLLARRFLNGSQQSDPESAVAWATGQTYICEVSPGTPLYCKHRFYGWRLAAISLSICSPDCNGTLCNEMYIFTPRILTWIDLYTEPWNLN